MFTNISISPENPHIFIGQTFTIGVSISNCKQRIMWSGAQISGILTAKTKLSQQKLTECVHEAVSTTNESSIFNFAMSGSRMISTDFICPKTFIISITVNGVPPTYKGDSISIDYELCIFAQVSGKPVFSKKVPITIICPHENKYAIQKTQSVANFTIESIESLHREADYSLLCPFPQQIPSQKKVNTVLQNDEGLNAFIEVETIAKVGSFLYGKINLSKSMIKLSNAVIKLNAIETFSNNEKEKSNIYTANIPLYNTIMKNFSLLVPNTATAVFSTDLFSINYEFEIVLSDQSLNEKWIWSAPIDMFQPYLSITTPKAEQN